ncbi:LuxR C-terminal-related transcriptional regulator [Streptomyces sp. NPDC094468]|uniref:helix-turn-helix transcriptional regulator n=1 Tax=Streptomyces sp. NPDC094468 TaxID=3366066 RepID=UPI003819A0DF
MIPVNLAPRTLLVVKLTASGVTRAQIAKRLAVTERAVTWDVGRACRSLQVQYSDHAALVNAAIRAGVITLPALPSVELEPHLVDTLRLVADGYTNRQIARRLRRSFECVKSRIKRILRTLHAKDRAHAVAIGWQCGLLGHDTAPAPADCRQVA